MSRSLVNMSPRVVRRLSLSWPQIPHNARDLMYYISKGNCWQSPTNFTQTDAYSLPFLGIWHPETKNRQHSLSDVGTLKGSPAAIA